MPADEAKGASIAAFLVISSGCLGSALAGLSADHIGRTLTCALSLVVSVGSSLAIGHVLNPAGILSLGIFWGFW